MSQGGEMIGGSGGAVRGGAYAVGARVRVTQQIPFGSGTSTTSVEGRVVRFGQQKTGSWFAHSKDDRLWLDRLELRKDDGELIVCNLDEFSRVEVVGAG
ncbi:MAG: hypothetical protein R3B46_06860 [Phycisphaerales bacterium]